MTEQQTKKFNPNEELDWFESGDKKYREMVEVAVHELISTAILEALQKIPSTYSPDETADIIFKALKHTVENPEERQQIIEWREKNRSQNSSTNQA